MSAQHFARLSLGVRYASEAGALVREAAEAHAATFPRNQRAKAMDTLAEFREALEKLVVASAKVPKSAAELEGTETVRALEGAFAKHLANAEAE